MKKNTYFGSLLMLMFFLSSCSNVLYTSLDVLRPAKVTFSPTTNRLLIVDNTTKQPDDYGHRTQLFNEKAKNVSIATDSLPFFCIEAMADELAGKDFFKVITIHDKNLNTVKDFFSIRNLQFDSVNSLCDRFDADVILTLDRVKVNDKIDEYYLEDNAVFYVTLEARYETRWSIYYPERTTFESATFRDTVYWDAQAKRKNIALSDLPKRSDALIDGAMYAGRRSVDRFIPYWDKVDRYFYTSNNKYLSAGIDSATVRNWNGAIQNWKKIVNSKKSYQLRGKAANNIAIAYEVMGDIKNALKYSEIAVNYSMKSLFMDIKTSVAIVAYFDELTRRNAEIELLDKQLGD